MIKQFHFSQFNLASVNKVKWLQVFLCTINNLIKHQSFIYTQFKNQTVLFLTIQFSVSFVHTQFESLSLNVSHFYLIHK